MLGYISNILTAHRKIDEIQDLDALQEILLRGKPFENIESIDKAGLTDTWKILKSGKTGMEYTYHTNLRLTAINIPKEVSMLMSNRDKNKKALERLNDLYLHGKTSMSEDEYNKERTKLLDEQEKIEKRLNVIYKDGEIPTPEEEEFIRKGSYVIMIDKLLSEDPTDFSEYFMDLDKSVVRNFVQSTIDNIEALNSKIVGVTFMNGVSHHFTYKPEPNLEMNNIQPTE